MGNGLFAALCAALDQFDAGFVAVFPDGKILHANRIAHEMMSDGWPIQACDGALQASSKKATVLLLKGLQHVTENSDGSLSEDICLDICLADAASSRGVAVATIKRLAGAKLDPPPVGLFVTNIRRRGDCALSAIADCFGLTPAETRTLHHFVEGGTVAEAARALAVSENTVKTHLQNMFAKTRSSRQTQLIKLVRDLTPPLQFATANFGEKDATRFFPRPCRSTAPR